MPDQPRDLLDELRRRIADPGAFLPRRFADGEPAETIAFWAARAVAVGLEDGTLGYVPAARSTHLMTELLQTAIDRDKAQAERDRLAAELAEEKTDNARLERRCDRLTAQRDERLTLAESSKLAKMVDDLRDRLKATSYRASIHADTLYAITTHLDRQNNEDLRKSIRETIEAGRQTIANMGTAPVPGSSRRVPEPADADLLLESAWGVIANVGNPLGDWDSMPQQWREAAVEWARGYHTWLDERRVAGESQASEPAPTAGGNYVLVTSLVTEDGEQGHPFDVIVTRVDLDADGAPLSLDRLMERVGRDVRRKVATRRPTAPKLAQGGIIRHDAGPILVGEQPDGCIVPQEADRG